MAFIHFRAMDARMVISNSYKDLDKKFRIPRQWSNEELRNFGHLFYGDIVNVSGWKDIDKEGKTYNEYFVNANSYTITNFKKEARGFQGYDNEIFLDLEKDLPTELHKKFDVVFNHTTLEHIFDFHKAMQNLCDMSKDIVILVVPFLQEMHGEYGDFWRFTPTAIKRLFEMNEMEVLYSSFNSHKETSVYLFFIATRYYSTWGSKISNSFSFKDPIVAGDVYDNYVGCHAISNRSYNRKIRTLNRLKRIKNNPFMRPILTIYSNIKRLVL